jgi:hypothetical protein
MAKKVLIGVGVGCGVLLLLVAGVVVAGGLWAKRKFDDTTAGFTQVGEQSETLAALDREFPFQAPEENELLQLEEKRLAAYFAIREEALPVFEAFEKKGKAFEEKHGKNDPNSADVGAAVEAFGLMGQLVADTRASYIESLKKHRMSPSEFHAITQTLYATYVAGAMQGLQAATAEQRASLQKALEEMDAKLESDTLGEQERTALQASRDALYQQLESTDPMVAGQQPTSEKSKVALAANAALLEKNQERIKKVANPAFDAFVIDGNGASNE